MEMAEIWIDRIDWYRCVQHSGTILCDDRLSAIELCVFWSVVRTNRLITILNSLTLISRSVGEDYFSSLL